MILTKAHRAEMRRRARELMGRRLSLIGVGLRHTDDEGGILCSANGLLWAAGAGLCDNITLTELGDEIDEHPAHPNCALLDLYCYEDIEGLVGNVYVCIKDGRIVDIHDDDMEHERRALEHLGIGWGDNREPEADPAEDGGGGYLPASEEGDEA